MPRPRPPLVYSCSGCSSAAQMTNYLALRLDRLGHAQMSCIAGVGGGVPALVKIARSGRPILALDGCPLECVRHCLARHGITASVHVRLDDHGVRKRNGTDFDRQQAEALLPGLVEQARGLAAAQDRGQEQLSLGRRKP